MPINTGRYACNLILCFRQTHPDAVITLMRWRITCPTPFSMAWYDAPSHGLERRPLTRLVKIGTIPVASHASDRLDWVDWVCYLVV